MASIFISRDVTDHAWLTSMQKAEHVVVSQSLLEINKVNFDKPEADWVFFYSKNGVKHFFEKTQAMLAPYRWACMGPKTAEVLSQYVLDIDFIGDGDPESTAIAFDKAVSGHEKVCYARASLSMQSVQQASAHAEIIDLIVYENTASESIPATAFDILAFTSPLNVKAFFSKRNHQNEQLIAIGSTTAQAIKDICGVEPIVCDSPSEEEMLKLVSKLSQ